MLCLVEEVDSSIIARQQFTNSSGTTTNSTQSYFAIDTTSGASSPVLIDSSASETDYSTDNFFIFGRQISWLNEDRSVEANFYARSTSVDGIWKLYWDDDPATSRKGTLVVLKILPPPHL